MFNYLRVNNKERETQREREKGIEKEDRLAWYRSETENERERERH